MITNSFGPIISGCDSTIDNFIRNAVKQFFAELDLYTKHNHDDEILQYANEQTLSSLFVNGLIRQNGNKNTITAVQEYGIFFKEDKRYGRPDIFIRADTSAIWLESKFGRTPRVENDHWNIISWLLWDLNTIFAQLRGYYEAEKDLANNTYSQHYLITLAFKLIKKNPDQFCLEAETNLLPEKDKKFDRAWYYGVGFIDNLDDKKESFGIEVYGTFKSML